MGETTIPLNSRLALRKRGHAERETMSTDACRGFCGCRGCGAVLRPRPCDCCVFCSYGDVPYPLAQAGGSCC